MQADATLITAAGDIAATAVDRAQAHRRATATRPFRAIGLALTRLAPSSWLLLDLTVIALAVCIANAIPHPTPPDVTHVALWQAVAVFAFAMTVANMIFGLYERETIAARSRILTRVLLTVVATIAVVYALIYVVMYATVSRRVCAAAIAMFAVGGTGLRFWACWALHTVQHPLLLVGTRALFDSFQRAKRDGLLPEYRLVGYATCNGTRVEPGDVDHWGRLPDHIDRIDRERVHEVVVGAEAAKDPAARKWMLPCLHRGCRLTNEAIFYEKATGQILVDEITPAWFLFADLKVHCDERATIKRVADLCVASIGLVLAAPVGLLIALAIRLGDGGPVFYSQMRVGQNGVPFRLYKFRTMRVDAENGRSVWASTNDPRVTRVGRWLRRMRFDELPQLYNVLIGQMSLVGPRPERPDIVDELSATLPFYAERHLVKPGITGWAQISYRYGASIEDARRKLQYDLYYLKHMCFELDMVILFRTLGTFLRGAC